MKIPARISSFAVKRIRTRTAEVIYSPQYRKSRFTSCRESLYSIPYADGKKWQIKKLNEEEKKIFWSTIPFKSIDEPIFIVEGNNFKLLALLVDFQGLYKPFWLDDLYGMSLSGSEEK